MPGSTEATTVPPLAKSPIDKKFAQSPWHEFLVGGFNHLDYFQFHICDNPSHWLVFFKMVIAPPTRLNTIDCFLSRLSHYPGIIPWFSHETPPLNALDPHQVWTNPAGLWSLLLQWPSQKALEGRPWGCQKIDEIRSLGVQGGAPVRQIAKLMNITPITNYGLWQV